MQPDEPGGRRPRPSRRRHDGKNRPKGRARARQAQGERQDDRGCSNGQFHNSISQGLLAAHHLWHAEQLMTLLALTNCKRVSSGQGVAPRLLSAQQAPRASPFQGPTSTFSRKRRRIGSRHVPLIGSVFLEQE
jgi:hypothetical protein